MLVLFQERAGGGNEREREKSSFTAVTCLVAESPGREIVCLVDGECTKLSVWLFPD